MSNQVVTVKRKAIAACMTCPLCNKIFRDATTINECLHTFCRKCICKKLSDVETYPASCPKCNTVLGGYPLQSLRPDHNLQDIRAMIFPYKRIKVKAPEIVPPVKLAVRRKVISPSSLVVSFPRVSAQSGVTRRRSKSITRKSSPGSSFSFQELVKKEKKSREYCPEKSSLPETLNQVSDYMRQKSSIAEPSSHSLPDEETKNGAEPGEAKDDLWKPLNCLVEVADKKKSSEVPAQGSTAKSEPLHSAKIESRVGKFKVKAEVQDEKKSNETATQTPQKETATLESGKPKKLRRISQKKTPVFTLS